MYINISKNHFNLNSAFYGGVYFLDYNMDELEMHNF
jgi:hypothetical protein